MDLSEEESNRQTEWWWIDYLEDEMDAGCEQDLELLLEHSQEDRDSFESFRVLRLWLRESDPLAGVIVEDRVVRLRAAVMQVIHQLEAADYRSAAESRVEAKSLNV